MSNALRRRLAALQNLTEQRGATPGEAAAAQAAIQRITDRLRAAGEPVEWHDLSQPCQDQQPQPGPVRRRARRKASHERPKQNRMHVGDVIDLAKWCRCGSGRYEVLSAFELGHAGMLRCVGCGRNGGWLTREDFTNASARDMAG